MCLLRGQIKFMGENAEPPGEGFEASHSLGAKVRGPEGPQALQSKMHG